MADALEEHPFFLFVVGAIAVLAIAIKAILGRYRVPAVVGYLGLGLALRAVEDAAGILDERAEATLAFLSEVGITLLLFRVGLESNPRRLLQEIPRAAPVWLGNVLVAAAAGFVAGWALGLGLVPSLFLGVSLSATSVAVSVLVWRETRAIDSPLGNELLVVAELDDLSAVALMAVLLAVAPHLEQGDGGAAAAEVLRAGGLLLLKGLLFGAFCVLFARWVERPLIAWLQRFEAPPERLVSLVAVGFIIAALAGWLGFSLAVGAFFAGLLFSRDPAAVRVEASIEPLEALFVPFFFLTIGFAMSPAVLGTSVALGLAFAVAAVAGKVGGVALVVGPREGWRPAVLLGLSLVPRAEIAIVVIFAGMQLGAWAVPPQLYGAVVVVSALTCIVTPIVLRRLLLRWRDVLGEEAAAVVQRPQRRRAARGTR